MSKEFDFAREMARMMPAMLRAVGRSNQPGFTKSDLALKHFVILDMLRERGACKMSDLSEALNLTMSAVTGIVDKMVGMGLVQRERSKEDRRVVMVELVGKGRDMARKVDQGRKNLVNELYSVLTRTEKKEYVRLLRKVYDNLMKKELEK